MSERRVMMSVGCSDCDDNEGQMTFVNGLYKIGQREGPITVFEVSGTDWEGKRLNAHKLVDRFFDMIDFARL